MFKEKKQKVELSEVPKYPRHCSCGQKTNTAMLRVIDKRGDYHLGAFSDFGRNNNGILTLSDWFTFVEWMVWCSSCYRISIEKQNIARDVKLEQRILNEASHG